MNEAALGVCPAGPWAGQAFAFFWVYSCFLAAFGVSKFVKIWVKSDKFLHAFAECESNLSDKKLLMQSESGDLLVTSGMLLQHTEAF